MNRLIATALPALVVSLLALNAEGAYAGICVLGKGCTPIAKGYWSWPRNKPSGEADILQACKSTIAFVAEDSSYFTLAFSATEAGPRLIEQGSCKFDAEQHTERCDQVLQGRDGKPQLGFIVTEYSYEKDGALKATVKGEFTEGPQQGRRTEIEMYPVNCPESVVLERMRSSYSSTAASQR
jgi:hypothetical protein